VSPESKTWPDEYASAHGTGQTWIPGTYDPELNLYYVGTGNPNPVMAEQSRKGDKPLYVLDRGHQSGYRQDGLVLPGFRRMIHMTGMLSRLPS